MKLRVERREPGVPWFLEDKLLCYAFCRDIGLDTVSVLRAFGSPAEISLQGLPEEFVLKPTLQHSTRGVMLLRRNGRKFFDDLRKRELSFAEIVTEQAKYFDLTADESRKIIVEEKLVDSESFPIPRDYKAYSFRGKVALLVEIDRNTKPTSVAWFDASFKPVTDGRVTCHPPFVMERPAVRPPRWESILDLARRASAAVPSPFARIDLYSSTRGPILGEVTLTPGGLYFGDHYSLSEEQQEIMGRMWEIAERELTEAHAPLLDAGSMGEKG